MTALQKFETAEANLVKLERLWEQIERLVPQGLCFGDDPAYEDRCREMAIILDHLPKIDGWRPSAVPLDLNEIAQNRFDAMELGEPEARVYVENEIAAPGREIRATIAFASIRRGARLYATRSWKSLTLLMPIYARLGKS
jgi:hypothetical protein